MSQHLLFRGPIDFGDGSPPRQVDVYRGGTAVVAFDGANQVGGAMTGIELSLDEAGRLVIAGTIDGEPATWTGSADAHTKGQWPGMRVRLPGTILVAAQVTWTQYGVTVGVAGQANRVYPGARTEVIGSQRFIVDGENRYAVENTARSCGSCGR